MLFRPIKNKALVRALQGLLLSVGSPVGWFLIVFLQGGDAFADLANNTGVYLYMFLGTAMVFSSFGWYAGSNERKLEGFALRDALTGLYNSRYFHEFLPAQFAQSHRRSEPLSLILLDLDFFKKINDKYGHLKGDEVLRRVGLILRSICRSGETVNRVGGEEFCVVLINCNAQQAFSVAKRINQAVKNLQIMSNDGSEQINISISGGVACNDDIPGDAWKVYAAADKALYQAKQAGRDRIEIAQS